MKLEIKDQYTKNEVLEIVDNLQNEIIELIYLHERYRNSMFNHDNESIEDGYIAAYNEVNHKIVRLKSDLKGDF